MTRNFKNKTKEEMDNEDEEEYKLKGWMTQATENGRESRS